MRGDTVITSTTWGAGTAAPSAAAGGDYHARAVRVLAAHAAGSGGTPLAEAEVAVRDALAVREGAASRLRLALARSAARVGSPAATRLYADHVLAAGDPEPPSPADLAALAEHGAWDLVAAWADDRAVRAALATADDGSAVRALLACHDAIASGAGAPGPDEGAGTAAPAVAVLAAAADEALRRPLPAAVRALDDAVDRVRLAHGRRAGTIAAGTAVLVRAAAVGPEDLLADPRGPRAPAAVPAPPGPDAAARDRLLHAWLDGPALVAAWPVRADEPVGTPALRAPLARWAVACARAERAVAAGRAPDVDVDHALTDALRAAGGDTGLTCRLRAVRVLAALRVGDVDGARGELAALDGVDPDRDRVARLQHLVRVLGADWTVAAPDADDAPRRRGPEAEHDAGLPATHPVAVAARAARVAGLLRHDRAAFVDAAGALADDLLASWTDGRRFPLSLRVVQVQVLLRLGRTAHAGRVARYVGDRLGKHLPDDHRLAAVADLALLRARLADGDAAALADPWPRLAADPDALRRVLRGTDEEIR